ncbi:RPE-retinal G protein-coupled receptor-like [Nerophis ophidion]|uniref:RPE-retinal G protein-coupled receptor-like n=1 Tax=Nerophis ophidion TaxID=159077 RepID=UPI002ADF58FD|nr:RPE-retinal G protein-coupled receptor-like [Nerophis ophidion]
MATDTLPEGFTDLDMYVFSTLFLITGVLGFVLNAVTIVTFMCVREHRSPNNFLVVNLALADMILSVNGFLAGYSTYLRHWPFGQLGCVLHGFHGMISVLASVSFMAAIAWDRYHQYCTRQRLFWSTTMVITAFIWVMAIFWASMPLLGWGVYDFEPLRTCCTLDYTRGDRNFISYMVTLVMLYLTFPTYIFHSCYNAIERQFNRVHHHRFNTGRPLTVMWICWLPYTLICLYACVFDAKYFSPRTRMMCPLLAKLNPICNVVLYSFGNEFHRGGVWYLFTGQRPAQPAQRTAQREVQPAQPVQREVQPVQREVQPAQPAPREVPPAQPAAKKSN